MQSNKNAMLLDNVPYAANGSFAASLWMRRMPGSNTSGDVFQYLFSHTNAGQGGAAAANQVRCCNARGRAPGPWCRLGLFRVPKTPRCHCHAVRCRACSC